MKLCTFFLFALFVGISCNCGCINCNKQFQVLTPPGARIQVIHRNIPCTCPTSIPYSVEIPVAPPQVQYGRTYGYEVQAEKQQTQPQCPVQQKYSVQMQAPQQVQPKYLVGLVASTDRIVIESPQQRLSKACQRPIIERVPVNSFAHPYRRYCLCSSCTRTHPNEQGIIWKPKRTKRSINYKLLALNSNPQFRNRRNSLHFRKLSQQTPSPQFVMVSDDSIQHRPIGVGKSAWRNRRRFRRSIYDRNLPFFESEEGENEVAQKPKRRTKIASKKAEQLPTTLQSMPLLKMLSLPLKYISNIHDNPIVGALPKMFRVSRKYFMDFVKNFVDDYKRLKRKKALHKKLYKRSCGITCDASRKKREIFREPTQQLVTMDLVKKAQRIKRAKDVDTMSWDDLIKELQKIASENGQGENKHVAEEFLSILQEISEEKPVQRGKSKREANFLQEILKMIKAERLTALTKKKRSVPELEANALKEEISKTTEHVQKLIKSDLSDDLRIYDHLLRLQNLKVIIVKKQRDKESYAAKIIESEGLKEMILQEIIVKVAKNDENVGKWIKTIILLQKFHCALQSLKKGSDNQIIQELSAINFVKGSSRGEILQSLKKKQSARTQTQIELLNGLKVLLASNNESKIKEEAALIWQSNNLKKLQRDSIVEIVEKLVKKQRIRQELKILFDLQKQLEECQEKQNRLLDKAITSRLAKDQV